MQPVYIKCGCNWLAGPKSLRCAFGKTPEFRRPIIVVYLRLGDCKHCLRGARRAAPAKGDSPYQAGVVFRSGDGITDCLPDHDKAAVVGDCSNGLGGIEKQISGIVGLGMEAAGGLLPYSSSQRMGNCDGKFDAAERVIAKYVTAPDWTSLAPMTIGSS